MKGWVYIITTKSMPNLLKVGFSTKDAELRAVELNNTGNPHPYEVRYDVLVYEPRDIEKKAHSILKNYNVKKEWFNCSIEIAITAIRRAATGNILLDGYQPEIFSIGRFVIQNEVATDIETGLMWLRFGYGQKWLNNTSSGSLKWINLNNAFEAIRLFNIQGDCVNYNDWRLPSIEELKYLIQNEKLGGSINRIFPNSINSINDWYWSSTPVELDDKYIYDEGNYGISFSNGNISWNEKYEDNHIRLVRDTKSGTLD